LNSEKSNNVSALASPQNKEASSGDRQNIMNLEVTAKKLSRS
jgi:hypothetical protein